MKNVTAKLLAAALALAMMSGLAACGKNEAADAGQNEAKNEAAQNDVSQNEAGTVMMIPNPFLDHENLVEAEESAGFGINISTLVPDATKTVYRSVSGQMIEIIYYKGEDEILRVRKAAGSDPIDGDYNVYEKEVDVAFTDIENAPAFHEKINGGKVYTVTWATTENGKAFSHALYSTTGLSEDEAKTLIHTLMMNSIITTKPDSGSGTVTLPSGQEVSSTVILITTAEDFSDEDLQALLKKYGLSVKYSYDIGSIYALSADHEMNAKELTALIESISKENKILSAEPDQVIRLTDPVQPTLSTE